MPDTAGGNYSAIDIDQLEKLIQCLDDASTTLSESNGRFRPEAHYFGLRHEVDEIFGIASWARDQLPDLRRRLELAQEIESRRTGPLPSVNIPEPLPPEVLLSEPVVVRSHSVSGDVSGTVEVKLANGMTATIDELSDGRYQVTLRNEAGVGYGYGAPSYNAGVVVDGNTYGAGYSAGVHAMLSFATGDVYYADSLEEAQNLVALMLVPAPARHAGSLVAGWINTVSPFPDLPTLPQPDEFFVEAGGEVGAEAQAMQFIAAAGVDVARGGYLGATVRQDGTTTAHLKGSFDASIGGHHVLFGSAGASFEGEVLVELDLDENGEPVALRLRHGWVADAHAGDAGADGPPTYRETTYEVPVEWEEDQELVTRALDELTYNATGHGHPPPPGESALQEIATEMADRSYRYRDTYSHETREDGVFANAVVPVYGYPLSVGVDGSVETVERTHTGREYWTGEEWVPIPGSHG